jgi:UDP-N-acetylglucosamine 1-carboxyvinyltransferase
VDVTTEPHPEFPTDFQAQLMALMLVVDGASTVEEIFEHRFTDVPGRTSAIVGGVPSVSGAPVMTIDLRAFLPTAPRRVGGAMPNDG